MKYSEKDMSALISEVEAQFADHLAKAEEQEKVQKTETEEASASEAENKAEAKQEGQDSEVAKSEKDSEKPETEFDYDEEDIQEMDKMYGSMTKAEAAAHLESLKRAHGVAEQAEESQQVVEKTEENEGQSKVAKSEKDSEKENDLLKTEIDSIKKENEDLKKSLESLTSALTKFVKKSSKAPKQKAITEIEYVKKSEDESNETKDGKKNEDVTKLSKSEVAKRLSEQIRSGKLEKSEREKITEFYDNGQENIDSIKHLL